MSTLPFLQRDKKFIAVWSGEEGCVIHMFGEVFHVPPTDEVADYGQKGTIYRLPPAKDAQGRPIPGTIEFADKYGRDPETMEESKQFDAEEALRHLHHHNKALLARGLTVVAKPEDVEAVREAGKPLWLAAKIKEWEETIRQELVRQATWEKKGQPAPESSSAKSVKQAIAGLKMHHRKMGTSFSKDELLDALSGVDTPFKSASEPKEEEIDIEKSGRDLYLAAEEAGLFLKKEEIAGLLKGDVEIMDQVADKIQANKVPA